MIAVAVIVLFLAHIHVGNSQLLKHQLGGGKIPIAVRLPGSDGLISCLTVVHPGGMSAVVNPCLSPGVDGFHLLPLCHVRGQKLLQNPLHRPVNLLVLRRIPGKHLHQNLQRGPVSRRVPGGIIQRVFPRGAQIHPGAVHLQSGVSVPVILSADTPEIGRRIAHANRQIPGAQNHRGLGIPTGLHDDRLEFGLLHSGSPGHLGRGENQQQCVQRVQRPKGLSPPRTPRPSRFSGFKSSFLHENHPFPKWYGHIIGKGCIRTILESASKVHQN